MTIDQAIKKAIRKYGQGSAVHILADQEHNGKGLEIFINMTLYDPHQMERGYSHTTLEDLFKDAERRDKEGIT